VVVVLVEQQPLLLVAASPDEHEPAPQLLAVQVEVQVAGIDGREGILALGERPGAPVPHDHVPTAVLTVRDHALEVEVAERVVLHVHGHALHVRIEGGSLRHRPAHQHAVGLEPEVVVETAGAVALHHVPVPGGGGRLAPRRLRRDGEVALGPVGGEPLLRRTTTRALAIGRRTGGHG
jgi:hypothetical protein